MSRQLPRTSHGYLPPRDAVAVGWKCVNARCDDRGEPAPRSWPAPCPRCGHSTDPILAEPWAHHAEGYRLRDKLAAEDEDSRVFSEISLRAWEYKDARLRGDAEAAQAAWQETRRLDRRAGELFRDFVPFGVSEFLRAAADTDDIDRAAVELLELYPRISARDVENDSQRNAVRQFLILCIRVLEREASIGHPREMEMYAAMRDVARRGADAVDTGQERGFKRVEEVRGLHRSRTAIARARYSAAGAAEDLPPLADRPHARRPQLTAAAASADFASLLGARPDAAFAVADAAVYAAHIQGDTGPLDGLIRQAAVVGTVPGIVRFLRARRCVAVGDLPGAADELDAALAVVDRGDDATGTRLLPQIHAAKGLLSVRYDSASPAGIDAASLDLGIEECRTGRQLGLRSGRTTAADVPLGRLLLWRAQQSGAPAQQRIADVEAALRLARRHCRSSRSDGVGDQLLLQEALAAHAELTDRGDPQRLHLDWTRLVQSPHPAPARARLSAAWAQWAAGTRVPELAADAYERLVAVMVEDSAARYGAQAKQRVIAAAQEYTEEAGYWLARTGRYRQAVLALELGRAVALTEVLGRDSRELLDRLRADGHADLADDYRQALDAYEDGGRRASPEPENRGPAWEDLRSLARRVAAVTGTDPLVPAVSYEDVIAQTGDGALVYVAAAKAGGYALIVAAHHDPQFVELSKLDRGEIASLIGTPDFERAGRASPHEPVGTWDGAASVRDAYPAYLAVGPAATLRVLWNVCMQNLLFFHARGRIVTLIPVGLLSVLPLHAAGEPDADSDPRRLERHAGAFSAVRYAPNARTLGSCRRTVGRLAAGGASLLAVDVPDGAGVPDTHRLNYVARETQEAVNRWPTAAARPIHDCTWEQFRAAAEDYTVWHFACHAVVDPSSILASTLCFKDRRVPLSELRDTLRRGPRRLAVLSACTTNATDAAVPNELVGLPSALLQAGFAGVVASAWAVDDLATAYLMTAFYAYWCSQDDHPAVALNRAQRYLRTATRADLRTLLPDVKTSGAPDDRPYQDPRYWAAFAYTGA